MATLEWNDGRRELTQTADGCMQFVTIRRGAEGAFVETTFGYDRHDDGGPIYKEASTRDVSDDMAKAPVSRHSRGQPSGHDRQGPGRVAEGSGGFPSEDPSGRTSPLFAA